ncbi:MAG: type II secretion system F family protein [Acetatifactor sp.]|nr:type II secretion system F family protein [Acetatifactor sp.]
MLRIAEAIYQWLDEHHYHFFHQKRNVQALLLLHPTVSEAELRKTYYSKKIEKTMLIICAGILIATLSWIKAFLDGGMEENNILYRGEPGEGSREFSLICESPLGEENVTIELQERQLGEQETIEKYEDFQEDIAVMILGDNISLEQVESPLILREEYPGYPFCVRWEGDTRGLVDERGNLYPTDEMQDTVLIAEISYQEKSWKLLIPIKLTPSKRDSPQQFSDRLRESLAHSEESNRENIEWALPQSLDGQELHWRKAVRNIAGIIFFGSMAIAGLTYFLADRDLQTEMERRKKELSRYYPGIVHKLTLYLGAGLSVRSAFKRIELECRDGPLRDEIVYLCRELNTGVPENVAYEHMGKRMGTQEYIRLSGLLCQNLKKGNLTLLQCLQEEAIRSLDGRLRQGRKLGEEASTKLLLPMVMLLLVVMIIVMMPAFMTMGV